MILVNFFWSPASAAVSDSAHIVPSVAAPDFAIREAQCLTAATNADGAVVTVQPCNNAASQKWTFTGGVIQIYGNKCLDVTEGVNADGTKMQIWTCTTNNKNQQWGYTVCRFLLSRSLLLTQSFFFPRETIASTGKVQTNALTSPRET